MANKDSAVSFIFIRTTLSRELRERGISKNLLPPLQRAWNGNCNKMLRFILLITNSRSLPRKHQWLPLHNFTAVLVDRQRRITGLF